MDKPDSAAPRQPEGWHKQSCNIPGCLGCVLPPEGRDATCPQMVGEEKPTGPFTMVPCGKPLPCAEHPKSEPEGPQDLSEEALHDAEWFWRNEGGDGSTAGLQLVAEVKRHRAQPAVSASSGDLGDLGEVPCWRCGSVPGQPAVSRADAAPLDALRRALEGLRYKPDPSEANAPDRFCDHAAEPCNRCEAARAALASAEGASAAPRDDALEMHDREVKRAALTSLRDEAHKEWLEHVEHGGQLPASAIFNVIEEHLMALAGEDLEDIARNFHLTTPDQRFGRAAAAPLGAPDARPDEKQLSEVKAERDRLRDALHALRNEAGQFVDAAMRLCEDATIASLPPLDPTARKASLLKEMLHGKSYLPEKPSPASGPSPDARLVAALAIADRYYALAPKHSHSVPGIWDGDNGVLAGKPCKYCAEFAADGERLIALASSAGLSPDALRDEALDALKRCSDQLAAVYSDKSPLVVDARAVLRRGGRHD